METTKKTAPKPATKLAAKPLKKPTATKTAGKPAPQSAIKPATTTMMTKSACCCKLRPMKAGLTLGIIAVVYSFLIHLYPIFLNSYWSFVPQRGNSLKYVMADMYPGYNLGEFWYNFAILAGWAFVDGFIFAFLFTWLYNAISSNRRTSVPNNNK